MAPGITVDGRIDLITSLDTGETSIIDVKSPERTEAEEITHRLRPGPPLQESPVIVIDRFIELCYARVSFGSSGRGRGRT